VLFSGPSDRRSISCGASGQAERGVRARLCSSLSARAAHLEALAGGMSRSERRDGAGLGVGYAGAESGDRHRSPVLITLLVNGQQPSALALLTNYAMVREKFDRNMSKPAFNGPPTPEEFQRQLSEFVRQHFQHARPAAQPETSGAPESPKQKDGGEAFAFNYKPREVKEYLDRFVIKQDEAKKVLSVALCDHYHHVRLALEGRESPNYAKQNVILIGPTGVGKTCRIHPALPVLLQPAQP